MYYFQNVTLSHLTVDYIQANRIDLEIDKKNYASGSKKSVSAFILFQLPSVAYKVYYT